VIIEQRSYDSQAQGVIFVNGSAAGGKKDKIGSCVGPPHLP
jgi:hypothetical protein